VLRIVRSLAIAGSFDWCGFVQIVIRCCVITLRSLARGKMLVSIRPRQWWPNGHTQCFFISAKANIHATLSGVLYPGITVSVSEAGTPFVQVLSKLYKLPLHRAGRKMN
jgi:hypothetical protein